MGRILPVNRQVAAIHMPGTVRGSFQGTARTYQQTLGNELVLILAAIVAKRFMPRANCCKPWGCDRFRPVLPRAQDVAAPPAPRFKSWRKVCRTTFVT